MTDIASALEKEYADHSQAERDAAIAQLKELVAKGSGSLDIRPHAIVMPLLFAPMGAALMWATSGAGTQGLETFIFLLGAALVAVSAWLMFGPRQPVFTLTEEGVRAKDELLPWSSIQDFNVISHSYNGIPMSTKIVLIHIAGFKPPDGLARPRGGLIGKMRAKGDPDYDSHLTLWSGAKGMNTDQLAQRIADFFNATHARAELARLSAQ